MKTTEKIMLTISIIVWAYVSTLIHLAILNADNNINQYGDLLGAGLLTCLSGGIIIGINMLVWGIKYQSRNEK